MVSFVVALPELMSAAAVDVASVGTVVATASQGAAAATTAVAAAAADEVSAAVAAVFSAHGQGYEALSAQVAAVHEGFVRALAGAAESYSSAEAAGAAALGAADAGAVSEFFDGYHPPLGWLTGNSPPPLLNWVLGQTVEYGISNEMHVVRITPASPTGENVVAIHGGAFLFPPLPFHWINYSVTAYQTGATFEVPIYPLVWEGGTAGTVVPAMAGLISSEIAEHGAANVSVTGDSAGGNLALAATQYLVSHGQTVPQAMVLLSPWLDVGSGPIGDAWASGLSLNDPLVSPLFGSLAGLPPTYVYSGSWDRLAQQAAVLEQAARVQGAPMSFVLANHQIHDWVLITLDGLRYWPQIDAQLGIIA
ncbi:PE domain-containing protein [Mycobacterium sp.]|uniref:PE domain-containing protein n=1 Tax=Mycobacterium sp. TaxID=1785 RepID=UPI003A83A6E5